MSTHGVFSAITTIVLGASLLSAQQSPGTSASGRTILGRLPTGATVSFVRAASGEWGIEIAGSEAPRLVQEKPAQLEVFIREDDIRQLAGGYKSVEKDTSGVRAQAEIPFSSAATFLVDDRWSLSSAVLSVRRKVRVAGNAPGGFSSAVRFSTEPEVSWTDVDYFAPGLLYIGPGDNDEFAPGGMAAYRAGSFSFREDCLPAPLCALSFRNGASIAVLNPSPRGDTTEEDTRANAASVLLDERFQFGALGAEKAANGGIVFGYWLPGTITQPSRVDEVFTRVNSGVRRRYNRIRQGFVQSYEVAFRFGKNESFPELTRNTWRWAWERLNPPVTYLRLDLVRRTLLDHLADRVATIDGRSGIIWIFQATTGQPWHRPDDMRVAMGFVGKNLEAADQLLRESDRDRTARGQRMRKLGLAIIDTFIRLVPMSPPAGEGFDLLTGEPTVSFPPSSWRGNLAQGKRVYLRAPSEDMRMLMEAYHRERINRREHPEWLSWCRQFADWLLTQQRQDGSFPRSWRPGTGEVVETSGSSSYNPVPLLVALSRETGESRYLQAAIQAAEYVWSNYGARGVFVGGTLDNPNIVDKEAGMLSLEAFLALYEVTNEHKWLARAEVAASYSETWIWIWNVPMPLDANDAELHWKKGVPTVGLQGITARVVGGVDEYMDWSAAAYAKLYTYTKDAHYLDVARVLLHDTKAMLALPGRTYDLHGPGWQQEHWNLGMRRGFGGHRGWLPWVSTNHLYSITGLEAFDPELYRQLCAKPVPRR